MQHPTARTARAAIAISAVLALGGCATGDAATVGDDGPADADAVTAAAAVVASIEEVMPQLEAVFQFETGLLDDYDEGIHFNERGVSAATAMLEALPESFDTGSAEDREAFDAMPDALRAWQEDSSQSIEMLEEVRPDLEPELQAWLQAEQAGNGEGPPPTAYMDLTARVNDDGALAFGDACAEFVTRFELTTQCYAFGGPGEAQPMDDAGPLMFAVGEVDLAFDPGPSEDVLQRPDGAGVDVGGLTLSVQGPPAVFDPSSGEPGGEPMVTMPWPEDVAAWAGQLPFDILDEGAVDAAGRTWSYILLENTDPAPSWAVLEDAVSVVSVFPGSGLLLLETAIEGETVVAVGAGAPGFPPDLLLDEAVRLLEGLGVADE